MSNAEVRKPDAGPGNVIPGRRVHFIKDPAAVCSPLHDPPGEPKVILIRDGDAVTAIEVVCTCGRRIRLDCVY